MSNLVEELMKLSMEELEAIINQKIKDAEMNFSFLTEPKGGEVE
ncbi:hypothetical protein ERICI_01300 [Paenibacillus larvae subsp. larvae]|uniref:Uncharacterized protein n=5 Tax=root TaxID=1 RepID=A0A0K2CZD4_9CAUD|nr:hypothetical protein [Paenibacillus larvae]YP_009196148.1 hypothetical protein VEGAS_49 [Paenibacillus phage Vegas]ALA12777.1 hypothetical protein HAYLEY_47 [Paenibacillus phage Hayley]ALA12864.1 hypothetical protein VADIM_49 [Paenibacillus phage Vadim]ALA12950.1 hypothetical protein DIANE_49 [Paenibacillus phage Diane]UYE92064.1 hypothetical protein LUNBUN_40 [Paenibacillus phage LunBun]UYE92146.1 hypothetical protein BARRYFOSTERBENICIO_40 [Paenibacillus phage BarryFoster_Benicio]UYL9151